MVIYGSHPWLATMVDMSLDETDDGPERSDRTASSEPAAAGNCHDDMDCWESPVPQQRCPQQPLDGSI